MGYKIVTLPPLMRRVYQTVTSIADTSLRKLHRPERHGHVRACAHNPEVHRSITALAHATRAQPGLQVESLFRESTILNRLIQSEANATLDEAQLPPGS